MKTTIKDKLLGFGRSASSVIAAVVMAGAFTGIAPVVVHADDSSDLLLPVGTVIRQRDATIPADLAAVATAKRVVYVSSDANGSRVLASGLVITPNVRPAHPNVVTWSHALSGVADMCAPSLDPTDYFYPEAVAAVKAYLQQGWVVSAPDFAGLGTLGVYQAFVGGTEARSVIDSVRAARNLDPSLTNNWVASGHSGGGSSPLFAGEIAASYGQGLSLKGIVSMAPLSNVDFVAPSIIGTPLQGELVIALVGLAAVDSSVHLTDILTPQALLKLPVVYLTGCVSDVLNAYATLTPSQLLVGGQLSDSVIAKLAQYDNPGQAPSSAPILLLQGTADEEIPASLTEYLQYEVCSQGSTSYLDELDGVGHDDLPVVTTGTQTDYINARFNGDPAPSNC